MIDIFSLDFGSLLERPGAPIQGGELDTSLLLHLAPERVRMDLAQDFALTPSMLARYRPGHTRQLPAGSPGSVGYPSLASAQKGELLYRFILDRISACLAGPGQRLAARSAPLPLLLRFRDGPRRAQERAEAKLVVQQGGREIGREEFTLTTQPRARRRPARRSSRRRGTRRPVRRPGSPPRSSALPKAPSPSSSSTSRARRAATVILAAGLRGAPHRADGGPRLRIGSRASRRTGRGPARRAASIRCTPRSPTSRRRPDGSSPPSSRGLASGRHSPPAASPAANGAPMRIALTGDDHGHAPDRRAGPGRNAWNCRARAWWSPEG